MLSHLFFPYFFLTELYFIPISSDKENRASVLFTFYLIYFPLGGIFFLYFPITK